MATRRSFSEVSHGDSLYCCSMAGAWIGIDLRVYCPIQLQAAYSFVMLATCQI